MKKIRLFIIEDNRLLRDGMAAMVKKHKDIILLAASGDGNSSILKLHKLKPDVILLDLGLRSQNSLHVVEVVKREFPTTKVIVMDLAPAHGDILQFVKAGVSGFILKDATVQDFLTTIRSVAVGGKVLPPLLSGSLFSQIIESAITAGNGNLKRVVRMTKREREVLTHVSEGLSNKEIATKMRIATYTVKSHVHNIMEKLALHSRLQVANYALDTAMGLKDVARHLSMINS